MIFAIRKVIIICFSPFARARYRLPGFGQLRPRCLGHSSRLELHPFLLQAAFPYAYRHHADRREHLHRASGRSIRPGSVGRTVFPNYAAPSASARLLDFNPAFFATNSPAKELRTCEKTTNHSTVTTMAGAMFSESKKRRKVRIFTITGPSSVSASGT